MNYLIGFWVAIALFVCALAAMIAVTILYTQTPSSKTKLSGTLTEGVGNTEGPSSDLSPHSIAGAQVNVNPFLATHAKAMFKKESFQATASNTAMVPDLALVSNFHNQSPNTTVSALKKEHQAVFVIDGEPNDLSTLPESDLIITTKLEPLLLPPPSRSTSLYLPCYASFLHEFDIDPNTLVQEEEKFDLGSGKRERTEREKRKKQCAREFAVFCYSNADEEFPGVRARNSFYRLLQKRTGNRVANLGKALANEPHAGVGAYGNHSNNRDTFVNFKFVIAFENKAIRGYISEKLINPFLAGAVPIYLGAPDVAQHFNPKRFINVDDFASFDACIDEVLRLDADPKAFAAMVSEPCLIDNRLDPDRFALFYGGKFYNELYHHVPKTVKIKPNMVTSNTISFVTFADGEVYLTDRVLREARESGYFDKCVAFGPGDLPPGFMDKWGNFTRTWKRGFGYWVWKPVVVQMMLSAANYNDVVVYCDSGCSILPDFDHKIIEYYRALFYTGDHDLVVFQMKYKASHWTKADLYKTTGLEMDDHSLQLTSSVIIVRKTQSTVKLINDWAALMHADPHNVDDSPSVLKNHVLFHEHRHDQSCWDLLARGKKHKGIFVSSDNFTDRTDMQVPLQPSRRRK